MKTLESMYIEIIHKIPDYGHGVKKISKRKIKEIMLENEYDEDYVEEVSDEFCRGFGVAKEILLKLIKKELEE